jgi:hypothetical protein
VGVVPHGSVSGREAAVELTGMCSRVSEGGQDLTLERLYEITRVRFEHDYHDSHHPEIGMTSRRRLSRRLVAG